MMKKNRTWSLDFGPVTLAPGETRKIDVQPKCLFRGEKISAAASGDDVRLLNIFVGREEQLKLNGDGLDFARLRDMALPDGFREARAAFTIEVEVQNRSREPRIVDMLMTGQAVM
jgi:hypothetical protein